MPSSLLRPRRIPPRTTRREEVRRSKWERDAEEEEEEDWAEPCGGAATGIILDRRVLIDYLRILGVIVWWSLLFKLSCRWPRP